MKSYMAHEQLRIVGKGWEVKQYLRRLTREMDSGKVSLASMLSDRTQYAGREGKIGRGI